jgi:nucleoside-diphosphate-sugar epimerase
LYGTGKPLRQVLYAKDLANVIRQMVARDIFENFNVASNENFSINQYAESILDVLGFNDWNIKYDSTKPDGQFRKDVSLLKFNNLFPEFEFTPLHVGISEVFESLSNRKISI